MQTDDIGGARREAGNLVDIERRGVGGEDRTGFRHRIELPEDLFFDAHVFEHRLDDEVDVAEVRVGERRLEQRHARLELGRIELAFLDLTLVGLTDAGDALVERLLTDFQQSNGDTGVEEIDGDPRAHGAGTDHCDRRDAARLDARGQTGDTPRGALGEEHMAKGSRHRAVHQLLEQTTLLGEACVDGACRAVLHRIDDRERRRIFFEGGLGGVARKLAERLQVRFFHLAVPCARQRLALAQRGRRGLGDGDRRIEQIGLDHFVEQRRLREQGDRQRLARQHHVECALDADQTGQTLRTARTRQQAELHLRQADPGAGERNAMVAAHRELETAAERHAFDRGDHRLVEIIEQGVEGP